MIAIRVLLDGETLATVGTEGLDLVTVQVHGATTQEEFAVLEMSGGIYPADGESTYLIWINSLELRPGQAIEVRVLDSGQTHPAGRTIDDLFPDPPPADAPPAAWSREADFASLRAKPTLREGYAFRLDGPADLSFSGRTAPADHAFALHVLWDSHRSDRARVSLHAYTIDELEQQSPLRDMVRGQLSVHGAITLQVERLAGH